MLQALVAVAVAVVALPAVQVMKLLLLLMHPFFLRPFSCCEFSTCGVRGGALTKRVCCCRSEGCMWGGLWVVVGGGGVLSCEAAGGRRIIKSLYGAALALQSGRTKL